MESGTNMEVKMSQQVRPIIENGKLGVGNFGVAVMSDGTSKTLRVLITPNGFHFESYDFDDVLLEKLSFESANGSECVLSFDEEGYLLINSVRYIPPSNNDDEIIKGNKTFEGNTSLKGGLMLLSPNGTTFNVSVSDDGEIKAERREVDGNSSGSE